MISSRPCRRSNRKVIGMSARVATPTEAQSDADNEQVIAGSYGDKREGSPRRLTERREEIPFCESRSTSPAVGSHCADKACRVRVTCFWKGR